MNIVKINNLHPISKLRHSIYSFMFTFCVHFVYKYRLELCVNSTLKKVIPKTVLLGIKSSGNEMKKCCLDLDRFR